VWGSAATAAICALTAVLSPWDFAPFALGFTASLATKLSDTFASEIGKAYGKTTYLITTLQLVSPKTRTPHMLRGLYAVCTTIPSFPRNSYQERIGMPPSVSVLPAQPSTSFLRPCTRP